MTRDTPRGGPTPPPDSRLSPGPDDDLDALLGPFLAAVRAAPPEPPPALTARVLRDADSVVRAAAARPVAVPVRPAPRGWLADFWAAVGGWTGGTGLAAATVAGLAVGFGAPGTLPALSVTGADTVAVTDADAEFVSWMWPGVGTVIDDLSAGLVPAEEG
jgi:hypothetical protein